MINIDRKTLEFLAKEIEEILDKKRKQVEKSIKMVPENAENLKRIYGRWCSHLRYPFQEISRKYGYNLPELKVKDLEIK